MSLALSGSFTPDFSGDHRNDADDLRLRGKPVRIEVVGTPGKVLVHAVKAENKKMLSFLRRALLVPAGRLVRAGDGWQPRYGYDVAVLFDASGLRSLCIGELAMTGVCGGRP